MDSETPEKITIFRSTFDSLIMNDVIEANKAISEGLLLAFEGCEANGQPLNDIQKIEILQCMMFCSRNLEQDMKANKNFAINMIDACNDSDFVEDLKREIFGEDEDDNNG